MCWLSKKGADESYLDYPSVMDLLKLVDEIQDEGFSGMLQRYLN